MIMNNDTIRIYIGRLAFLLVAVTAMLCMAACDDDTFSDFDGRIPEGTTTVNIEMNFEPMAASVLQSRGDAAAGDVVKKLKDFSILFYNMHEGAVNPVLRYDFSADDVANRRGMTVDENVERDDVDASNNHKAESHTTRVTLKLNDIPYGSYRIFAVANLGGATSSTAEVLDSYDDISTPEKLQFQQAVWDSSNMLNNSQMTGFFSVDNQTSPSTATQVGDVVINRPNMNIHSWLRRLASKITIDYDASKLRNDVTVIIKKVTVRDIARVCNIGAPNIIVSKDDLVDDAANHSIEYAEPIVLTSSDECAARYPRKATDADYPHTETAPALFFFENMQGEVDDKDQNGKLQDGKLQDGNGDGIIDYPNANNPDHPDHKDYKDGLKFGTYIEVEAEYESTAQNNLGKGSIKYRFMIGSNITTNCDAERNHHYKLTLIFLGNANEVDWHIDYEEDPGFYGPNPYFVSYLYNQLATYPIKISGTVNAPVTMTILKNDWSPYNAHELTYFARPSAAEIANDVTFTSEYVYNTERDSKDDYKQANPNLFAPWNGFLSLAEDQQYTNIGMDHGLTSDFLYDFWCGKSGSDNSGDNLQIKRGVRSYRTDAEGTFYDGVYKSDGTTYSEPKAGAYKVTKDPNSTTIHVPFFTRQKQLCKPTAYTGNNPYVAYQRQAKIQIDYSTEETGPKSEVIDVYQVKRIVNPKGVWRRHDNSNPFEVTLMEQERESSTDFTPARSVGPWRAYVWRGNTSFITLNGKSEVRGGNGTTMEFTIGFKGTIRSDQTRCAIIRVEYNNYSCYHLIFVRQGYAPIALLSGEKKWHTSNVSLTSGTGDDVVVTEGPSPADEGSLFRYANIEKGIIASENAAPSSQFTRSNAEPIQFDPVYTWNPKFKTSDGGETYWNDITAQSLMGGKQFPKVKIQGKGDTKYSVAEAEDYRVLVNNVNIDMGFGVLYGDEADKTATKIDEAYGYCSYDGHTAGYGMRGVFVYNRSGSTSTLGGNNLFFPIGRAGFGHRKHNAYSWAGNRNKSASNGVLQYAGRADWYNATAYGEFEKPNQKYLPLFYDVFRSNGALYWLKAVAPSTCVLDVNYQTMDFSIADEGVSFADNDDKWKLNNSDACFVRLVDPEEKKE